MNVLDKALQSEQEDLELLLHRLTTLRLMMAGGNHRMIGIAARELDDAMATASESEQRCQTALADLGFSHATAAVDSLEEPWRSAMQARVDQLRALQADVKSAAAATAAGASKAVVALDEALTPEGTPGDERDWGGYGPTGRRLPQRRGRFIQGDL